MDIFDQIEVHLPSHLL